MSIIGKEEIWKDIKDYEGSYQVSNFGRVRSLDRSYIKSDGVLEHRHGQLMTLKLDKDGYYMVGLRLHNKPKKCFRVNILVAKTFIENPHNYDQINHKDENKLNNNVENLEWCDSKYNNNYGHRTENIQITKSKLHSYGARKPVLQFDLNGKLIHEWQSASEIERQLNYSGSHINQCCHYQRNKANGYIWRFKEEELQ